GRRRAGQGRGSPPRDRRARAKPARWPRGASIRRAGARSTGHLDLVVLDDRVRQHLVRHLAEPGLELGGRARGGVELDLDELAHPPPLPPSPTRHPQPPPPPPPPRTPPPLLS